VNTQSCVLAIIIPAYKPTFLRTAILSLINELTLDCKLYIFDDCSPYEIEKIALEFNQHPRIVYKKFETNLGKNDLAAQWNRCIQQTQQEPWIWLFSDDDEVTQGTLTAILEKIKNENQPKLLAMNVMYIDQNGNPKTKILRIPEKETAEEFALKRLNGDRSLFAADHVFSKALFQEVEGFVSYPVGWYSDEVTWHKMAKKTNTPIERVENALLLFRMSGQNISSSLHEVDNKLKAQILAHAYWKSQIISQNCEWKIAMLRWVIRGTEGSKSNIFRNKTLKHLRKLTDSKLQLLVAIACLITLRIKTLISEQLR